MPPVRTIIYFVRTMCVYYYRYTAGALVVFRNDTIGIGIIITSRRRYAVTTHRSFPHNLSCVLFFFSPRTTDHNTISFYSSHPHRTTRDRIRSRGSPIRKTSERTTYYAFGFPPKRIISSRAIDFPTRGD